MSKIIKSKEFEKEHKLLMNYIAVRNLSAADFALLSFAVNRFLTEKSAIEGSWNHSLCNMWSQESK